MTSSQFAWQQVCLNSYIGTLYNANPKLYVFVAYSSSSWNFLEYQMLAVKLNVIFRGMWQTKLCQCFSLENLIKVNVIQKSQNRRAREKKLKWCSNLAIVYWACVWAYADILGVFFFEQWMGTLFQKYNVSHGTHAFFRYLRMRCCEFSTKLFTKIIRLCHIIHSLHTVPSICHPHYTINFLYVSNSWHKMMDVKMQEKELWT